MKAVIIISMVLFVLSVESASHKKHKTAMKSSSVDNSEWPQPGVIRGFEVPPEFTASPSGDDNDDITTPSSGRHHGKLNHKNSN